MNSDVAIRPVPLAQLQVVLCKGVNDAAIFIAAEERDVHASLKSICHALITLTQRKVAAT